MAEPEHGMLGRYSDDPTHREAVSERNNCGMGMVFIRARTLTLRAINDLVTRLRNLEVNTTKRFVCMTAMESGGLDREELLLGLAAKEGKCNEICSMGDQYHRTVLEHCCD